MMAGALYFSGSWHIGGDDCSIIALLLHWLSQNLSDNELKMQLLKKRNAISYFMLCSYMQIREETWYNYVENGG